MSGERNHTSTTLQELAAAGRNALAPAGGLLFDGSTGSAVTARLTGQNIDTEPFTLSFFLRVPTTPPASSDQGYCVALASSATAPNAAAASAVVYYDSDGKLYFSVNAAAGAANIARLSSGSSIIAAYGGRTIHVAAVRPAAGSGQLYINAVPVGVPVPGYTGSWQAAVTSTYLDVGFSSTSAGSSSATAILSRVTFYNLALSPAEVQEVFEGGGAVPERYKFGQVANKYPGGFVGSFGASDTSTLPNGNANGTTWSAVAGARPGGAGAYIWRTTYPSGFINWFNWSLAMGAFPTARVRFWARLNTANSGNGLAIGMATQSNGFAGITARFAVSATWTQYSVDVTALGLRTNQNGLISFDTQFTGALELDVDDIEVIPIGAVVHLPLDDGAGFFLRDESTNGLHATTSVAGVWHTAPRRGGLQVRGATSTAGNQQLLGASTLPKNARILNIYARARTGTPTVTVGLASGASELVAATALNSALEFQKLTLKSTPASFYNGDGVITNLNFSPWVNSTMADPIDWVVSWEPLG